MTFSKWMTIAAALVALGAVGGGVRVAARQDGTPTKESRAPVGASENAGAPARKALEEVQSWINRYEHQIAAGRDEIAHQQRQIKELEDRIRALEARPKAEPVVRPAPGTSADTAKASSPSEPLKGALDAKAPAVDRIIASEMALVSISGSNDRVIIYGTSTHRSRTYRLPHDMKHVDVSFHGVDVIIVANGSNGAHLAEYNLTTDRWALQDLRGGTDGQAGIPRATSGSKEYVLPCLLNGSGFTQIAVFDVGRGSWSIQNLLEPTEQWAVPIQQGRLAMYVLGRHVYAYSAETGTWDTLTLDETLLPNRMMSGPPLLRDRLDMFAVSQHGRLHLFTEKAGRWETVNPKD
jgi:hypothetical protein